MSLPFAEKITVIRKGEPTNDVDAIGNPVPTAPTEQILGGWAVAPRDSSEAPDLGEQSTAGYTLYRRLDADIRPTDVVEVRGERWAVIGEVNRWRSPYTGAQRTTVIVGRSR